MFYSPLFHKELEQCGTIFKSCMFLNGYGAAARPSGDDSVDKGRGTVLQSEYIEEKRGAAMKILFASDISLNWLAGPKSDDEVSELYREVFPCFDGADFTMVNMENIFGLPSEGEPISKLGPNLIAGPEFENILDALRPTVVNFANNHVGDYGPELAMRNFARCREKGYLLTGCGANLEEAYTPVYLEKDGVRVGIFGVCENEFGLARESTPGSAAFDLGHVNRTIQGIREAGALPIVYFHGGNEFNPFPSPWKTDLYRLFIDLGARAVIAMHTHCPQGYESYHGGAIVYSMGNFYFPRDKATYPAVAQESWFYGYLSMLDVTEDATELSIVPYHFDSDRIELLKGERLSSFSAYMSRLNEPLSDAALLRALFDSWSSYRGFDFITRASYSEEMKNGGQEELKRLKSVFTCEAHYELVRNTVNLLFYDRMKDAGKYVDYILALQNMRI